MFNEEINDITIGDWSFDVFLLDDGNLGFTIYGRDTNATNSEAMSTEIHIDEDFNIIQE